MTIGETLATARRDAGLTLTQVSQRTRIRESIIRGIEQDDYAACGGDFYARGHIRSIAQAVGADPGPLIGEYDATLRAPEEITAADALRPTMPITPVSRRRPNWTVVLALALLAAIGYFGYHLAFGSGGHASATAAGYNVGHGHTGHHAPPPAARRSPTPTPTPSATPTPVALTLVSAEAFGPGGTSAGDNASQAAQAVDSSTSTFWPTNWYATATFAGLKSGTGLLIDLGKTETIDSVQLTLGAAAGTDLQMRVGNTPSLADLATVASATDASGALPLRPATPAQGRYVLIWFTKLPPDNNGTFQADVYNVSVQGQQ
jgi:transcriptional regulator with XRE-family HTH domain